MKIKLLLCLLVAIGTLWAEKIKITSDAVLYHLVNTKNNKIYPYYLLEAGNFISLEASNVDSLEILSRKLIQPSVPIEYFYDIITEDTLRITRSARLSGESRGIQGDRVSTFNKYILAITKEKNQIVLKNSSSYDFIVKFDAEKWNRQVQPVDYVAFSPESYQTEKILILSERDFTYFEPKKSGISLTLEGPLQLKIISRLLFEDAITSQQSYSYKVFNNEKQIAEFLETAVKSQKAKLIGAKEMGVSTGNVQYITLEKGIHQLKIESPAQNREVIFRFFINKSAMGTK